MKGRVRKGIVLAASVCLYTYIGLVARNIAGHGLDFLKGDHEVNQPGYGDELRQEWADYSQAHLERLANPRVLVPFSYDINDPERPLEVNVVGPIPLGVELRIDSLGRDSEKESEQEIPDGIVSI